MKAFADALKRGEVPPLYKIDGREEKSNYRSIRALSIISKEYERFLYGQIYFYFDKIFSKYQCGFRKGVQTQHVLQAMTEKMKTSRDSKQFCGAIQSNLPKTFDCICYELLLLNCMHMVLIKMH